MSSPKCYIICSHSNRIVDILKEYGVDYKKKTTRGKPKNCAILEFRFDSKHHIMSITEIYEGDTSNKLTQKKLRETRNEIQGEEATRIYVIRHAEGEHNTHQISAKVLPSYTDPKLTKKGIQQSKQAGKMFRKFLGERGDIQITNLFVSNLQRSYFTLYYFLHEQLKSNSPSSNNSPLSISVNTNNGGKTYSSTFIVLPNSEEVSRFNFGYENTSTCQPQFEKSVCTKFINDIPSFKVTIDWNLWFLHKNMFGLIFNDAYKMNYNPDINIGDTPSDSIDLDGGNRPVKNTRRHRHKHRKQSRRYK